MLSVGGTVCRGHWIVCDALTAEDYTNAIMCIFPLATNIKLPDIARSHIRSIQRGRKICVSRWTNSHFVRSEVIHERSMILVIE